MSDVTCVTTRTKTQIFKVKELSKQKALPWLFDAVMDWSMIVGMMLLVSKTQSIAAYFFAILVIGNRQHALAILGHDGAHFAIHTNRRLNDALANLFCFWPLMITTEGYRALHFVHHNNTGTSKDPELLHKKARAPQWDLPFNWVKILRYVCLDFFGYSLPDLLIILSFSKPKDTRKLIPILVIHLSFIAICALSGAWHFMLVWYGSIATSFMMFFRLRLWLEHQGTYSTQRVSLNPIQAVILSPHQAWLHWEHHKYPTVPYHKLEKVRALLEGPAPVGFLQLIRNLKMANYLASGSTIEDGKP